MDHGYWEPHSSSVDFCESNYRFSPYLVELHNAWSSLLGIAWFGALGLWQTTTKTTTMTTTRSRTNRSSGTGMMVRRPHQHQHQHHPLTEWRVRISFAVLLWIGLGSTLLHGTLHWIFQSSDELPMLYIVLCELYSMVEMASPPGRSRYPWLPIVVWLVAIWNTVFYYVFQDWYWVFLVNFSIGSTMTVIGHGCLAFQYNTNSDKNALFRCADVVVAVRTRCACSTAP
jgi:dihydroceramidase